MGFNMSLDANVGGMYTADTDTNDQSGNPKPRRKRGCYEAWAGSFGTAIGTGAGNTAMIVAYCSQSGIAARICSALVLNGYSDWFLPSKDELNLMYQNLNQAGLGSFANDWYWSSTENNSSNAWLQNFSDGGQVSGSKGANKYVRAVRVF
jgi:hypothetical protein